MENVATYSEARSEYTKQLATFIIPATVGWFQTLWSRNASDRQRCLTLFQTECEEVSRWNQDRIHDEVRVLLEKSGCDYMEELMTAVFVAHTKVLTAVRLSTKQKKLSITVPKLDHFLHRVFRECARSFWKAPFLFMSGDSGVVERQKNLLQIEGLASEAITTAVRGLLPVKQILHDYLGEDGDDEVIEETASAKAEEVKEEEEESEKPKPKSALKKELEVNEVNKEEEIKEKEVKEPAEPKATEPVTDAEAEKPMPKSAMKKEEPAAESAPAIVKIDTEEAVHFSDYDDVYDEKKGGGPTVEYNPKDGDDDDIDDGASDTLTVDESSAQPLGDDDVEDLEAPPKPSVKPAAKPAPVKKETIDDDEVVVLE